MSHLSLDVSAKISKQDIKGYFNHTFRKEIEEQGKKLNHSNEDINSDLTSKNISWNLSSDGYGSSPDERMKNRLNDYNATNKNGEKRALRSDAVLLRGFVLQPSADIFENMNDDDKRKIMVAFGRDSIAFLSDEFGGLKNIIGASTHLDETNPHMHVAFMPMTDDGRLTQKEFFKGPKQLASLHKRFREHMNDKGWTFEVENKNEDTKHVSDREYKRNAKTIEKRRKQHTEDVRNELLNDESLRNEVKEEIRRDLIPLILDDERALREKEYKEMEDKLNAREEHLKAYYDDLEAYGLKLDVKHDEWVKEKTQIKNQKNRIFEKAYSEGYELGIEKIKDFIATREYKNASAEKRIAMQHNAIDKAANLQNKKVSPKNNDFDLDF